MKLFGLNMKPSYVRFNKGSREYFLVFEYSFFQGIRVIDLSVDGSSFDLDAVDLIQKITTSGFLAKTKGLISHIKTVIDLKRSGSRSRTE